MSGLEIFLDGGATVFSLVGAAGAALGYKQNKRDETELVEDSQEITKLRDALTASREKVDTGHRAVTSAWGIPASLFEEQNARDALCRGVPVWAVACVCKARSLTQTAAELRDLSDLYDSQLNLASQNGKGVLHSFVRRLTEELEFQGLQFSQHLPCIEAARSAFELATDSDSRGVQDWAPEDLEECVRSMHRASSSKVDGNEEQLPIAVLRDRGLLGEVWRVNKEAVARVARARQDILDESVPEELASWAANWLQDDPGTSVHSSSQAIAGSAHSHGAGEFPVKP